MGLGLVGFLGERRILLHPLGIGEVSGESGGDVDEHFDRVGEVHSTGDSESHERSVDSFSLGNESSYQSGLNEERGAEVEMVDEPAGRGLLREEGSRVHVNQVKVLGVEVVFSLVSTDGRETVEGCHEEGVDGRASARTETDRVVVAVDGHSRDKDEKGEDADNSHDEERVHVYCEEDERGAHPDKLSSQVLTSKKSLNCTGMARSAVATSLEKRLMMRPSGFESKKDRGACTTRDSIRLWSLLET